MISRLIKSLVVTFTIIVMAYTHAEPLHEVADRPQASDFSLPDMDGEMHRLTGYRGKVVIVNFWATWCPPCRFELPSMEKAYAILKEKDIVMLAINVGEDSDTIFSFTADYPVTFPLLLDKSGGVIDKYPVIGLPTSFIINPQGQIVYRVIGTREWTDPELINKVIQLK